ncbi:MAG TPA: hypothetical protein VGF48_14535 [Thermoanaerobaculia bacterium]|jgi:hypothetical protein
MNAYEEPSDRRGTERRDHDSDRHTFGTGATLPFDPDSTWSTPVNDPEATYPLRDRARN